MICILNMEVMRNLILKYVSDIKVFDSNSFYFKMNYIKLNFDHFLLILYYALKKIICILLEVFFR